jgi:GT2 family glycosyltransferase
MVFYRRRVADSESLRQLVGLCGAALDGLRLIKIVAYDNSPGPESQEIPPGVEYVGDLANGGVTAAYNHALKRARLAGADWLWLLDQDTQLTADFWVRTGEAVAAADASVMAIVPRVWDGGRLVSPTRIKWGDVQRPLAAHEQGRCDFEVAAIGSGVLVRCEFLERMGGFDPKYWLDSADRKLFAQIWETGGRVFVSGATLHHELSVFDFDNRVSETRYGDILKYEWLFQQEYKSRSDHAILALRLLYRTMKLLIIAKNKRFALMTLKQFAPVLRNVVGLGPREVRPATRE